MPAPPRRLRALLLLALLLLLSGLGKVAPASEANPTLREVAEAKQLVIGTTMAAVPYENLELLNPSQLTTLCKQFSAIMPTNALKWSIVHPGEDVYDFAPGDIYVGISEACRLSMYGHALVSGFQLPKWLTDTPRPEAEARAILREHIFTVMSHFDLPDWDVVLEAFEGAGYARNYWMDNIGSEYVELAFRWAHEADPDARLWYNDYSADVENPKSTKILDEMVRLRGLGLPIHGVGFQMHLSVCPPLGQKCPASKSAVVANLKRFSQAGFEVRIPAIDVRLAETTITALQPAAAIQAQATVFRERLEACLTPGVACWRFSTLGISDANANWIKRTWPGSCCPLLFDDLYQRKQAFFGVRYALLQYDPASRG